MPPLPEPVTVFLREWVWWTLLNGFSVPLALPAVVVFLVLVLFFRLGIGIGLPRLFWHPDRFPQFMIGIGVGAVVWQTLLAGYVFEEFATNFTVDRPPFCEVRPPYTPDKGLPHPDYPGRFRYDPADIKSVSAYAGTVAAAAAALAVAVAVLVLVIQFAVRFVWWTVGGWRPFEPARRRIRVGYAAWLPLGAAVGWGLMTGLTAGALSVPREKLADPVGNWLVDTAGWGKASERRAAVERHVSEHTGKPAAPVRGTQRERDWFAPYHPAYAAFVVNFAAILVVSLVVIVLPAGLRLYSPAIGIILLLNLAVFLTILLTVFPPLAVSSNFVLIALFVLAVVAGRAYKFRFPNLPRMKGPIPLDARYRELVEAEAGVTDRASAEAAAARVYAAPGGGPAVRPVFSHAVPYPHPAVAGGGKPPLAIVSVSGGGSRAAAWAMQVLTTLEERFLRPGGGRRPVALPYHTRLVVGASGGMIAGAYYVASLAAPGREPGVNRNPVPRAGGGESPLSLADLNAGVRQDLLTPITHTLVNHDLPALFAPAKFGWDRGQALDEALRVACRGQLHVPVAALRDGEAAGWRPSLIFSPMLVEDGRQLFVSNLDLRRVTENRAFILGEETGYDPSNPAGVGLLSREGVEFFKLFPGATEFTVATAVRMSASFPYVLPGVMLPTNPPRRVVDAGYYDNFGIGVAASWLFNHLDWVREHTSGVVVIQVRDGVSEAGRKREAVTDRFPSLPARGLHWLTTPPAALWNSLNAANTFRNDNLLHLLEDTFVANGFPKGFFATVAFELDGPEGVALNFTLVDEEVRAIEAAADEGTPGGERFRRRADALLNWWHARLAAPAAPVTLAQVERQAPRA
jgi:predicted acylesterase/phospholipase RssA